MNEYVYPGLCGGKTIRQLTFLLRLENSMHKPIYFCATLGIVLSMSNVCCLGHIAQTCNAVLYGSTPHLVVARNLKLVITVC